MKEVKNKTKVEKRKEQKKKMKNKKILILSIIINLVFLLIICIFISGYKNIIREKKVIKEMTTSTLEENLNAQITQLNKSHTDYANSIEESKKKIASAITEKGVKTSSDATLETMSDNIENISNDSKPTITTKSQYFNFANPATVNLGTGLVLYETLFPVVVAATGGDQDLVSASITYTYNSETGDCTVKSSNRYTIAAATINFYILNY